MAKTFSEEDLIKLELEKHFGPYGLKYPVIGLVVFIGGLTSEVAREAYVNNRPYKNLFMPEVCAEHAISAIKMAAKKSVSSLKESMAAKKSVSSLKESELKGKRVLVSSDLNVPLYDSFKITDDTLIHAAVPTIKYLMSNGARVILSSHLGRPKGVTAKLSLKPLVPRLSELLGIEEELDDPEFAKKLASLADLYVNDAFGTAHRAHASTEGVAKHLKPSVAGFLMQKEHLTIGAVSDPKKPFAAIVGGSKVLSKIGVIESLLNKVDILISYHWWRKISLTLQHPFLRRPRLKECLCYSLLPSDVVISDKFVPDANSKIVPASSIPDGWMGLDIGPDSIKTFSESLDTTKTAIWNGPMCVVEFEKFAAGTEAIAHKLAYLSGKGVTTIIGGGDSVAAVEKVGLADKMSYISAGGGASLELLEGRPLPGVLALDEA
ncbi:phosphoglycerate kinase, cytosolic [Artemisia annua]|uniref:Phosphoglycerate kinase n=1 Tax=Artemisia annua TaxID=35608 RepID=A0A2U1NV96_ARTAN|nr:phosphoglycerate kinase, cytosolic [Artemisia annua]